MLTAADVMTKDVAMIRSSATVKEAVDLMRIRDWRALIIDRRHEQDAYGIITESDIVYKVISYSKDPNKVRVYEIMTKPCIVVNPELGLEYVARLFANHYLRRAPVISGKLLGIISLTDILARSSCLEQPRSLLLEQELQDEIKKARIVCVEKGINSTECAAAWDVVEEIQAEIAHQLAEKPLKTAFEDYCDEYPELAESRIYDL
ncbi:CP12 domain-containing protein [Aphanizomenon flos-aquae NRERC-008]|jgi:CBS domain-containing protein|uniref:CBS domain-containing protein n=1 Tax=Aphanizomenon flos-aquae FACHB-1249 TaxID=2692889 RepID=A0ABR8IWZ3_APHFL|nr:MULTISPECIES: CP12 domain-containing protein [Aphanizomenon]MBD1217296.1 CBS domain-containing protein [Aphanizomenon flos-aquae Clear-A1]MBO1062244.1 CBS domain-containing protein [Aphanizomenon flos-aquae CP01]MCE2905474.1 CBS domain-containing protein [Anabaena sp. CoA2_C59]MDJ0505954.1 CBS domain-containing protein [Nostocales cyanobacterium LE14-WE12]NTW18675.1 CBS domain-containing protein [Nostocales cyanobacterium W4_Combined_metabat2_030]